MKNLSEIIKKIEVIETDITFIKKALLKESVVSDDDQPTEVDEYGNKFWKNEDGKRHRDGDKPAVIRADGTKCWYKNDKLHRDGDKPAVILADGTKWWFKNGKRHRGGDEHAVIDADGTRWWCKNGLRHRDGDKPAVIRADGKRWWYKNGKFIKEES